MGFNRFSRLSLTVLAVGILAVLVVGPLFAGGQEESAEVGVEEEFTIGFDVFNSSHPWAIEAIKFSRYVARTLEAELDVAFNNLKAEDQIANVENFVSKGVDAVVLIPLNPNIALRVAPILERAEIPWAIYEIALPPDIASQVEEYDQYVGFVGHSNENTGGNAARAFLEDGKEKAVVLTGDRGTQMHEERTAGFRETFESGGGEVLAVQYNLLSAEESTKAMEALLAAHPDVDAVYGTGATFGMGAIEALRRAGKLDEVDVIVTDLAPDLIELMRSGELDGASGGHWVTPGFAIVRAYAALTGDPLGDSSDTVLFNMVSLTSDQDIDNYMKWHIQRPPFSPTEIKSLVPSMNPDAEFADLVRIAENFGIDNTVERREADQEAGRPLPPEYESEQ